MRPLFISRLSWRPQKRENRSSAYLALTDEIKHLMIRIRNQHNILKNIILIGGRTRTRTWDPLIKSQLLYQLSYASVPGGNAGRRVGLGGVPAIMGRGGVQCFAAQEALYSSLAFRRGDPRCPT